ncbi:hypothetical protein, partial [Propionicicella superfundia]|uniref:hypothetical protein n=1 Tax=Propionicicella superfundia TaxID=348582 RepID=UPI00056806B0
ERVTSDGAAYTVPDTWTAGENLTISGTGWTNTPGTAGSVIALKLDDGGVTRTTGTLANPATGATISNTTIWAVVQADETGAWELSVPFPTTATANTTWAAGETHTLRFLTGSLLTGDKTRSADATVTITTASTPSASPSQTATPPQTTTPTQTATPSTTATSSPTASQSPTASASPTASSGSTQYTDDRYPGLTYTVPATLAPGSDLVISGTGWNNDAGTAGSVLSVLLDASYSGDPNTVYTLRDVTNPVTGSIATDKRLHAIVRASGDGSWTATIPYPTSENARLADGTWPGWSAGSQHQIRLLSGSLATGDVSRTLSAAFTIAGTATDDPTQPPSWAHRTVTVTADAGRSATAWVQRDVSTGGTIAIKGTGWVDRAGSGGSTVAIKLNGPNGTQYSRLGSDVIAHPSATGDDTIWALLAPSDPDDHPHVFTVDSSGNFSIVLDAPPGLQTGQYLSVQFQSGRFDAADTVRSTTSEPLVVNGVGWSDTDGQNETTCVPTSSTPTVTIVDPQVSLGGTLRVSGTGWCHPGANRGGSRIAIKIDEGAYSHLDTSLHQNRTIWAIVDANAADGTFTAEISLPDGTASGSAGSDPAFGQGSHTLRLLTGSLKTGDTSRTLESAAFVVGTYRPNGTPDPVDATSELTAATRGGVSVARTGTRLVVTIPGARSGDWVYLNLFEGDSPRFPWGSTWFRADASGRVTTDLSGITLRAGTGRLTVQSGNPDDTGRLLGWATLHIAGTTTSTATTTTTTASATTSSATSTPLITAVRRVSSTMQRPTTTPTAPVARGSQLSAEDSGGATGVLNGKVLTVTVPKAQANGWVYVYVYTGARVTPVGWVQVSAERTLRIDLSDLGDGRHRVALLSSTGSLLGWVEAAIGATDTAGADTTTAETGTGAAPGQVIAAAPVAESGDLTVLLLSVAGGLLTAGLGTAGWLTLRSRKVGA